MALKVQFILIALIISRGINAQLDSLSIELESGAAIGAGDNLPFWLQSNRHGIIKNNPVQFFSRFKLEKSLITEKIMDYSFGISVVGNINSEPEIYFEEWYAAFKFYSLQFKAGSFRKTFPLYNHMTGSGNIIWSENGRPLPEISISTIKYLNVPFSSGWVQVNGGLSHGWMEKFPGIDNTLLHHKWLFIKTGNKIPLQLTAGIHHIAQWGGQSENYGVLPSNLKTFWKIFIADAGGEDSPDVEQLNAIGNHLGSYQLGMDYHFPKFTLGLGWQTIFEDNSGRKFQNFPDGLYILRYKSVKPEKIIKELTIEFLVTDNQSGPLIIDSIGNRPPTGRDNYFAHHIYLMGWTSHLRTIGTPFITSPVFTQGDTRGEQIVNNRVRAFHLGLKGDIGFLNYRILFSHTINKGTYDEEFEPHFRDNLFLLSFSREQLFNQYSTMFLDLGLDRGKFYGNNFAIMFRWILKWRPDLK